MSKSKPYILSDEFQQKKRKVKLTSILFALVVLGVNIFAWFAYVSSANLKIDASVAAWDVVFTDGNDQATNAVVVNVKMFPGMEEYLKTFRVANRGEVMAEFSYVVKSMELFGNVIDLTEEESSQVISDLENKYPFSISFKVTDDILDVNETSRFLVNVKWDYDSENAVYYGLDRLYNYDPTLTYYRFDTSEYIPVHVDENDFLNLRESLFLDKDSADSYFGEMCGEYEKRTNNACLKLNLNMIVQQTGANDSKSKKS